MDLDAPRTVDLSDLASAKKPGKGGGGKTPPRTVWNTLGLPVWRRLGRPQKRAVVSTVRNAKLSLFYAKAGFSWATSLGWVVGTTSMIILIPLYRAVQGEQLMYEQARMQAQMYPGAMAVPGPAGPTPQLTAPKMAA
jgi:hypothetical protein